MTRIYQEPKIYKNDALMHDFNELLIRIKTHLYDLGDDAFKNSHPKPTVEEIDRMTTRIMTVLQQDSEPMKKWR